MTEHYNNRIPLQHHSETYITELAQLMSQSTPPAILVRMEAPIPMADPAFTAVYMHDPNTQFWAAWIEEIPGANSQGRTLAEARENLREAVNLLLDFNREQARALIEGAHVIREPFHLAA